MSSKKVEVEVTAKDETPKGLAGVRERIAEWAGDIRTKFVEAFAIEHVLEKAGELVKDFLKESIAKASEAESAWAQLRNTLSNFGLSLEHIQPDLEAHIAALHKVTNIRTDEAVAAFNTLLQTSGDYQKSLDNLGLVVDLAAAKHLSLDTASQLVGRVLAGNTQMLTRYGIVVGQGADAIQVMTQRFGGSALAALNTYDGAIGHAKTGFENLEEAIGDVITGSAALRGDLKNTGNQFDDLADQIKANKGTIERWITGTVDLAEAIGAGVGFMIMKFGEGVFALLDMIPHAVNDVVDALNHIPGFDLGHVFTLDGAVALFKQRADEANAAAQKAAQGLRDAISGAVTGVATEGGAGGGRGAGAGGGGAGGAADTDAKKAAEEWKKQQEKFAKLGFGGPGTLSPALQPGARPKDQTPLVDVNSTVAGMHGLVAAMQDVPTNTFTLALAEGLKEVQVQLRGSIADTQTFGDALRDVVREPVREFAAAASTAFEAWATHSGSAGKAFKGAMQSALEGAALKEGKFYEAKAIAAFGELIFTGNPQAALAMTEFGLASAAFFALAGASGAGAAGGGGGGGGSARGSGTSNPAANVQGSTDGTVTVVLQGRKTVFDHANPDDLYELQQMIESLAGSRHVQFVFED